MIIQLSIGQGPMECQIGVTKLYESLQKEFPDIKLISKTPGTVKDGHNSIRFSTKEDLSHIEGTIQWICESPIRPNHKRKNWFIDVSIIPEVTEINDLDDYKIEKLHSGGKGGQNVNKVETGVRVTHIPTGLTTVCTEERSQYMNKQKAIKRIQEQLKQMKIQAENKQTNDAWREHTKIVRGNPVRIYKGQNFKLVKN